MRHKRDTERDAEEMRICCARKITPVEEEIVQERDKERHTGVTRILRACGPAGT